MSVETLKLDEIKAYRDTTLSILNKQITILQSLDDELKKEKSKKSVSNSNEGILNLEKSKHFQQILDNEIIKLKEFDVVLAVVGTMKAGKSTTINAIVGREILPNRNRPMTALPTLICHTPNQTIPTITIDRKAINEFLDDVKGKLHLIPKSEAMHEDMQKLIDFIAQNGKFQSSYKGEEEIFEFLYQLNDLVRLTKQIASIQEDDNVSEKEILKFPFDAYKDFKNLPRINVEFNLDNNFETEGKFMLLDTAGPNESGQDELKEALAQQLERSSAVLIVLDYTQLNSDAEKDVKKQIDKIPTVQKSRLFALVNKFDQKNANADEADATRTHIYHNLLKDKIHLENVYAISAQDSYLANRMLTHITHNNDLPAYTPKTWVEDFAKKVYGEMAEDMYPMANVEMVKKGVDKIIARSRMQEPMQNVVGNMQKNAPFIAMQSALAGASQVFDSLYNSLNTRYAIQEMATEEELNKLHQTAENLKSQINQLSEKKTDISNRLESIITNIEDELKLSERLKDVKSDIKTEINQLVYNHQDYIKQQGDAVSRKSGFIAWLSGYETEQERNDRIQEREKLRHLVKSVKDNDKLTFQKDGSEIQSFHEALDTFLKENIIEGLSEGFEGLMTQQASYVKQKLTDINNESNFLLNSVKDSLKSKGISLRLNFDLFNSLNKPSLNLEGLALSNIAKQVTKTHNQGGTTAKVKRLFGGWFDTDWGTYDVDYIVYATKDIVKILENLTNEVIESLKKQVENQTELLLIQGVDYITNFEITIKDIISEIDDELKNNTLRTIEEKQEYKTLIGQSKQYLDNLKIDWDSLAEKFEVNEIKTTI